MPILRTKINITDNSGVKVVKCIKVLKNFTKKGKFLGKFVIVSVKKLKSNKGLNLKVKKGQLFKAFLVRTKQSLVVKNGIVKTFNKSVAILLTKQNNLVGTRIFGVLPKQVKSFKKIKLGALALGFI